MGIHSRYADELLNSVLGKKLVTKGSEVEVSYGPILAYIDGIVRDCCAIEVESRVNKQIRGAILDLMEHPLPKKLLIIMPVHMTNPEDTKKHCEYILEKMCKRSKKLSYRVVLLKGTGNKDKTKEDKKIIRKSLQQLGCI